MLCATAEVFELSGGEIDDNTYDRLGRLDLNDPPKPIDDMA